MTTTRKAALEKAAEMLEKGENNALGEQAVSKYLTLAQLWIGLAHEMAATPPTNTVRPAPPGLR